MAKSVFESRADLILAARAVARAEYAALMKRIVAGGGSEEDTVALHRVAADLEIHQYRIDSDFRLMRAYLNLEQQIAEVVADEANMHKRRAEAAEAINEFNTRSDRITEELHQEMIRLQSRWNCVDNLMAKRAQLRIEAAEVRGLLDADLVPKV